jgi:hypothetical protein
MHGPLNVKLSSYYKVAENEIISLIKQECVAISYLCVLFNDNANCSKYLSLMVDEKNIRWSNGGMMLTRKTEVLRETCLCANVYTTSPRYNGL